MTPDILIIGGGPTALTAALYAARGGRSVLMLEKDTFGGQVADAPLVENFPGFRAASGSDFATAVLAQATAAGATYDLDEALTLAVTPKGFKAHGNYGDYEATAVILATGMKRRRLDVPGEKEFLGHGISYCAVCDGPFYAGQDVAVIGDGNAALSYALLLAATSRHVYLTIPGSVFHADVDLISRLAGAKNLEVLPELVTQAFHGETHLTSIAYDDAKVKKTRDLAVQGAFIAIGEVPDNERFLPLVTLQNGFIVTDEELATKTPGLFAAGDCRYKKSRRLLTTAVADGSTAALNAIDYLEGQTHS